MSVSAPSAPGAIDRQYYTTLKPGAEAAESSEELSAPDNPLPYSEFLRLQTALKAKGINATLQYVTDHPLPEQYRSDPTAISTKDRAELSDREGNPAAFTMHITTRDIHAVAKAAIELGMKIGVLGAKTSGTSNFGRPGTDYGTNALLAIQPKQVSDKPEEIDEDDHSQAYPLSDQYKLTKDANGQITSIFAGVALTPTMLNTQTGKLTIPLNLTTRDSAFNAAVFATGGRGPDRIAPYLLVKKIVAFDGEKIIEITGKDIEKHQGMLGLDLVILGIEWQVFEQPKDKFLAFVPLKVSDLNPKTRKGNWAKEQGYVVGYLHNTFVKVDREAGRLKSDWDQGFLHGAETVFKPDLESGKAYSPTKEKSKVADHWLEALGNTEDETGSVYGLMITGQCEDAENQLFNAVVKYKAYSMINCTAEDFEDEETLDQIPEPSDNNPFEILAYLYLKGRIHKPHFEFNTKVIKDSELLREGLPDSAKVEVKEGKGNKDLLIHSKSTDFTQNLNQLMLEAVKSSMSLRDRVAFLIKMQRKMLDPALHFDQKIQSIAEELEREKTSNPLAQRLSVRGWKYGHGNPNGIDMHERGTLIANIESLTGNELQEVKALFLKYKGKLEAAYNELIEEIVALAQSDPRIEASEGEKAKFLVPDLLSSQTRRAIREAVDPNGPLGWRTIGTPQETLFQAEAQAA